MIIGTCGICCDVCRLYTAGACSGCPGRGDASAPGVTESACAILACATTRQASYCTRDCPDYPCELYRHGLPVCDRVAALAPLAPSAVLAAESGDAVPSGPTLGASRSGKQATLYVFCLGPLRVVRGGRTITEAEWGQIKGPTQKVKALFAFLLAKGSCGATKDEIVELLWGGQPGEKSHTRLHAALYYLRRALEPDLASRAESRYVFLENGRYVLAPPGGCWVDAAAFEAHSQAGLRLDEAGQAEIAARHWRQAAILYRGDYMADLEPSFTEDYVDDCCQWRRYRLHDMRLMILLKLAYYHFKRGEDQQSLTYAQQALVVDRCCEEAHRLIMRLRHRAGQADELTRQYHLCERSLSGAEARHPSSDTSQLYQHLLHTLVTTT